MRALSETAAPRFGAGRLSVLRHNLLRIWFLASTALYKRYCGSGLGLGWSLINPAAQIAILTFAFGYILRVPIKGYIVYLASGLLPWNFLVTSLISSTGSLTGRVDELNATIVPRIVYVLADV